MKLPIWLYRKREGDCLCVRRYGSRRPLRFVVTVITDRTPFKMTPCVMVAIGRAGVQVGPEDGISEGFTSMPRGSRYAMVSLRRGIGVGLTWEGRG